MMHPSSTGRARGALHKLAPLGPVPGPLRGARPTLRVLIPYTFKSSMIR